VLVVHLHAADRGAEDILVAARAALAAGATPHMRRLTSLAGRASRAPRQRRAGAARVTAPAQAGPAAAQRAPIQPAAAEGPAKAAAARGAAAGGARWRRAGAASQLVQALGGAVGARGRGARRGAACATAVLCARRKRAGASAGPASQTLSSSYGALVRAKCSAS